MNSIPPSNQKVQLPASSPPSAVSNPVPTLCELAFAPLAAQYLNDPQEPENAFCAFYLREMYSHIKARQKARIEIIKNRAIEELQNMIALAFNDPWKRQSLVERLAPNGPFGQQWLQEMYEAGSSSFNWYVYYSRFEGINELSQKWLEKVKKDFKEGRPHSFPQMAQLIKDRQIGSTFPLSQIEPFDHPRNFLPLLEKMAYIGVREAQFALQWIFTFNKGGSDRQTIQLDFSDNQRLEGLKTLVKWGHPESASTLGSVYCHNKLNGKPMALSEKERRDGMDALINTESAPNFYVTRQFAYGKLGELQCGYTIETRLAHLTKKARDGNLEAFSFLWELYTKNEMGDTEIPLQLNAQERWKKLEELRTPHSKQLYTNFYTHWLINPSPLLPCTMTTNKRMESLKELVFEENSQGTGRLTYCYMINQWDKTSLNIPIEARLKGLEKLVIHKADEALVSLSSLYLPEMYNDSMVRDISEEKVREIHSKPFRERHTYILNLALKGRHYSYIEDEMIPRLEEDLLKRICNLAMAHLKALKNF